MSKYHDNYVDGCETCAYMSVDETEEPCKSCCHCYTDKYVKQSCKECVHVCVCWLRRENQHENGFGCAYYTLDGGRK